MTRGNRLDLGLLRVLIAIYETRQVSAAAERLFLTQPTVSYSLAKLRDLFGDLLFVRTSQGMKPTEAAETLYLQFSAAVRQIDAAAESVHAFDPATSQRRFRVAMSEAGEALFLPKVLLHLRQQSPSIQIEVVQQKVDELAGLLASGQIDAVVGGNLRFPRAETRSQALYTDRYMCLLRKGDPKAARQLSRQQFAQAHHVDVTSAFSWHYQVDSMIRAKGIVRKIAAQVPNFISLPYLLAHSDLMATIPGSLGALLVQDYPSLMLRQLPVALPKFEVCMYWHEKYQGNTGILWLKSTMESALSCMAHQKKR